MMRYSVQARDRIFVKGYGFLSYAKNMGKNIGENIRKSLRGWYSQKILNDAKESATDVLKTTSKRMIQKTPQTTGDLIGNKIANKITKISKIKLQKSQKLHDSIIQKQLQASTIKKHLKEDIYLQKKGRKLLMI